MLGKYSHKLFIQDVQSTPTHFDLCVRLLLVKFKLGYGDSFASGTFAVRPFSCSTHTFFTKREPGQFKSELTETGIGHRFLPVPPMHRRLVSGQEEKAEAEHSLPHPEV